MAGIERGASGSIPTAASGDLAAAVSRLLDDRAIRAVVLSYAIGIDTGDDDLLGSCFAEDAVQVFGDGTRCTGRAAIVAHIRGVLADIRSTTHIVGNVEVSLDGDDARARSWGTAHLVRGSDQGGELLTRGLRYDDRLTRRGSRWVIVERHHAPQWMVVQPLAGSLDF